MLLPLTTLLLGTAMAVMACLTALALLPVNPFLSLSYHFGMLLGVEDLGRLLDPRLGDVEPPRAERLADIPFEEGIPEPGRRVSGPWRHQRQGHRTADHGEQHVGVARAQPALDAAHALEGHVLENLDPHRAAGRHAALS